MLLADKRDLQNSLKLSLIQIEEKELNYYTNNCMTIGTQAAMLTGFAFAALVEVKLDDYLRLAESQGYLFEQVLMCAWYLCAMLAGLLEMFTLVKAMQLSILAPGLALRGPEGSMTRALVTLRHEYKRVHTLFYAGLFFFLGATAIYSIAFHYDMGIHWQGTKLDVLRFMVPTIIVASYAWLWSDIRKVVRQLALPNALEHGVVWAQQQEEQRAMLEETRAPSSVKLGVPLPGRPRLPSLGSSRGLNNSTVFIQRESSKAALQQQKINGSGAERRPSCLQRLASRATGGSGRLALRTSSNGQGYYPQLPGQPVLDRRPELAHKKEIMQAAAAAVASANGGNGASLSRGASREPSTHGGNAQIKQGRSYSLPSTPPLMRPNNADTNSLDGSRHGGRQSRENSVHGRSRQAPPSSTSSSQQQFLARDWSRRPRLPSDPGDWMTKGSPTGGRTPDSQRRSLPQSSAAAAAAASAERSIRRTNSAPGTPILRRRSTGEMPGHLAAAAMASLDGSYPGGPRRDSWPNSLLDDQSPGTHSPARRASRDSMLSNQYAPAAAQPPASAPSDNFFEQIGSWFNQQPQASAPAPAPIAQPPPILPPTTSEADFFFWICSQART